MLGDGNVIGHYNPEVSWQLSWVTLIVNVAEVFALASYHPQLIYFS